MNMPLPIQRAYPEVENGYSPKKARTRAETHAEEKIERILTEWADWCHEKLIGQGYGGGVDFEGQRLLRAADTCPNPVEAEFIASENDDQGQSKRVHSIILGYTKDWKRVAWRRWVGRPVVTNWREIRHTEQLEVGKGVFKPITILTNVPNTPSSYAWSGLQTMETVAKQVGFSLRTVERICAQVKRQLPLDLAAIEYGSRRTLLQSGG